MALVLQDRVKESSSSSGTGSVVLSGAFTGYRTFASCIPNGSTVYYCIHNLAVGSENEWEVGYGTYTLSTTTLSRTTVLSSSNAGALVNFTAGANGLEVFITYPAEKAIYEEINGETLIDGGPITVVGSNVTSLPTLPAELGKFVANVDLFAQIYNYNQNSGQNASADFVAYNSDTDANGSTFFVDMGINSPNYSSVDYPIFTPHSGYVFSYGDGNTHPSTLFVGSGDNDVRIFAGGLDTNNTVATFGTDLSTTLEGALDVGSTLNVTGVTTLSALAYTSGNIAAAANNTVLVTKAYVDNATAAGLDIHTPVRVEQGSNLTATYNNGTAGVGATLTNSGTQVALTIDGISVNVADRVLVYGQTTATENGVYTVTNVGSGSTNWVLTRATDADTYAINSPNALSQGSYFYVTSGTTGAGESYVLTTVGTITFGTTAITFSQFSASPTYTGGTNINITGQTISLTGTVAPTNGGTGVNTVTTGDLLYGSATNTWSKLAKGTAYKSLVMNAGGTQVEWNAVSLSSSGAVSGVLPEANGGTNNSTYVTGDTLYASGTNTLGKLGPNTTTTKKFLSQTGTGSAGQAPAWAQPAASDITGLGTMATQDGSNVAITGGNVTLLDTNFTLQDNTDATKQAQFQLSGITTGTTVTYTLPAGTAGASTLIDSASTQTITGTKAFSGANVSFGTATASGTYNLGSGATSSGATRTINIGNAGVAGSTTSITIGSANGTTVNINGTLNASGTNLTALNASNITSGTIANIYTTAASANGASTIVARDASGNFSANTITATQVNTSGAGITSLNASVINSGTIGNAYTTGSSSNGASTLVLRDASGNFTANNVTATNIIASGSSLTSLNASAINSGTIGNAYTTASSSNGASTIVARDASGNFTAATITATAFSGSGASLTSLNGTAISSGTVANARTTATDVNGASTIVARDASGNFAANTITANLTGTASNATVLQTARTIAIGTGATGTATSFNGSAAITIPITDVNASYLGSGTVPVARVSGSYTGITGVGTLTAGTWNAGTIPVAYGGTGATTAATALSNLGGASTGKAIAMTLVFG